MRQCFIEEREASKVALGKNQEKTGAKEDKQGKKEIQVAVSGKGLWYNHPVVPKPSSSEDTGVSRIKITASAAELIDKLTDSGDSNISASPSESEFEDAGDDSATSAVF